MPRPRTWKPRRLPWRTQAQLARGFAYGPRKVVVAIQRVDDDHPWTVIGIETSRKGLEAIFGEHAHAIVGSFEELGEAIAAAEVYGEAWLERVARGAPPPEICACDEIDAGSLGVATVGADVRE